MMGKRYDGEPTMSQSSTFTLTTPDGVDLFVYCWLPAQQPKAIPINRSGVSGKLTPDQQGINFY
jgi:hypothetical protein